MSCLCVCITADGNRSMGVRGWGGSVTGYVRECAVNNISTVQPGIPSNRTYTNTICRVLLSQNSSKAHVYFRFCKNTLCRNSAVVQPFCSSTYLR